MNRLLVGVITQVLIFILMVANAAINGLSVVILASIFFPVLMGLVLFIMYTRETKTKTEKKDKRWMED